MMLLSLVSFVSLSLVSGLANAAKLGLETPSDGGLPILNLPYARIQANAYDAEKDIYTFKNIPFAAPPTGQNRFAAPQPPVQNDTLSDGSYGFSCIQLVSPLLGSKSNGSSILSIFGGLAGGANANATQINQLLDKVFGPQSENCLYLDVYVPGKAVKSPDTANLAVIHYIHGGAYVVGSKQMQNGTGLIEASGGNVITVFSNYRLGGFGFLAGSTMEADATPNAGLHDVHAAFNWTRSYISHLGGNPDQISAWGESAGGGALYALLTASGGEEDPHFQTAVIQSPAIDMDWDRKGSFEDKFQKFAAAAGCQGQGVACLRTASLDALKKGNEAPVPMQYQGRTPYQPVPDGSFIRQVPALEYKTGNHWKNLSAIILSHTRDEGTLFLDTTVDTPDKFAGYVSYFWPDAPVAQQIINHYARDPLPQSREHSLIGQSRMTCNVRATADALLNGTGTKVYNLQWAYPPGLHGTDINPTFAAPDDPDAPVRKYTQAYQAYLVSLARAADPNVHRVASLPPMIDWPQVDNSADAFGDVLNVGALAFGLIDDAQNTKTDCGFWDEVAAALTQRGGYAPPGAVVPQSLVPGKGDASANFGVAGKGSSAGGYA